ncbi:hypothetical protein AAG570_010780 [Ranatra chinensis]|uniref:Uncharacterized protein n=1 Tax=Ranatra chinensis TaxID=642074 RepID=A0ABD0YNJ0_9HEMI
MVVRILCNIINKLLIFRIAPLLLRWLIKRYCHFDAKFGRIGMPYMTLHDVCINANGYVIEIDQIGFRSSFLSSEVTKLVCIVVHDMRINKDIGNQSECGSWKAPNTFQNVKIPPLIITLAQFVSFSFVSVTCALVKEQCVFHCTLSEVQLDASVVHSQRSLLTTLGVSAANLRLLKQAAQPSLAHIATTLSAEATIVATTPLSIQVNRISIFQITGTQ